MIEQVCITDHRGPRFYTHADFPLSIGSHPSADIQISTQTTHKVTAFLLIIVNRTYIESNYVEANVLINDEKVIGQKEIRHNDILQIGDSTFHCEHIGNTFSISLYDKKAHLVTQNIEVAENGDLIEPIAVPKSLSKKGSSKSFTRFVPYIGFAIVGLLVLTIAYIFTAKTLLIVVEPIADNIELDGKIWPIKIKGRYIVHPGKYNIEIIKSGYQPIRKEINVNAQQTQKVSFLLKKKPGFITIMSLPDENAQIFIDDKDYGFTPIQELELDAGTYKLKAIAERYQLFSTQIVIEGKEKYQNFNIELLPNWAEVTINSEPSDAEVWINGENKGHTPLNLDLLAGKYNLEIRHQDYISYVADFLVIANEPLQLPLAELYSSPSHLVITSTPTNASVLIANDPKGATPLTIRLNPNIQHELTLTKPGYRNNQQAVVLKPGEQKTISEELEPILGSIFLNVKPKGSKVFINGKFAGSDSLKLSLPSAPQRLEVKNPGYEVVEKIVTPSPNMPKILDVTLNRITNATNQDKPTTIRTSQGQELKLIFGGKFVMGSSRREQGRRSNETLHTVELIKPFYISTKEVTNGQFKMFMNTHNPGSYKGIDLSAPDLPVVNLSWDDAARYCNWLSENEGLDKVYKEQNGSMVSVSPIPSGYRLPTESEWAWVARVQTNGDTHKYSWGNSYPPNTVAGNYADISAAKIIDKTIAEYNDGSIVAAPVGNFKPNRFGIYDLGGNVAEWCHDYHSIYPSLSDEIFIDPTGPPAGKMHVIRGASWMRGDLSTTRLSYRDRDNIKRIDVGFRIGKYID